MKKSVPRPTALDDYISIHPVTTPNNLFRHEDYRHHGES